MRTITKYVFLLILSMSVTLCLGQDNHAGPKVPDKSIKELEDAVLQYKGGQTTESIARIKELIRKYPEWTTPRHELAQLYYTSGQKQPAITELEASIAIDTASQLQQLYTLGRIYEEVNDPLRAMACYQRVAVLCKDQPALVQKAAAAYDVLEQKRSLWEPSYTIDLHPFNEDINTPNHESLGRWTLDGQTMIFTRLLNGQEDIFMATFDTTAGLWAVEDFPFNSTNNEGAHAISPDGNYLIFTSCNRDDGFGSCDLYLSVRKNNKWSAPVNMGPVFNSASWDAQPCFGLDGLSLYYSSSRPGGMGGRDIWYVYQVAAGKWSKPVNAGPTINTADNEESPFIHFDGQSMYFMRDGKGGLGGYDLYMSRRNIDGSWQTPKNMGAPINSGANEGALSLHPNGTRAIITRETENAGNDLFDFDLPAKFRAAPLQALEVTIIDALTAQPLRARIELFENDKADTIRLSQWTDELGKIAVVTQRGKPYGVMVSAEGYVMYSSSLNPDTGALRKMEIRMIQLATSTDQVIVLKNIFFETGSASLLATSDPELNKLLWTLRNNPTMRIEIRGHTDATGDEATNQKLSEARAKSVYSYLIQRGIEEARLSYVGFGETQPVADNATAEGRMLNRRTEFRVVHN